MLQTTIYAAPAVELTSHRRSLKALTGIRFFAAAYVVVYHTKLGAGLVAHGHSAAGHFLMSGYLAVSLFFLLSGFILAYTYAGQIDKPGDYRRFWEARFARIWPVYVISLLLTSAAHLNFPKPTYILATLLMVQAWNPFDRAMWGAWNYVCWTLSVEALFYLCFPWYQEWIETLSAKALLAIVAAMLGLGIATNSAAFVLGYPSQGVLHFIPLPLLRLPEFLAGAGLGNYFLRKEKGFSHSRLRWTYLSSLLSIALLCTPRGPWTSLVLIAFACLVLSLAAEKTFLSQMLSSRIMLLGGGISYSIYLLQAPVKDIVLNISDRLDVESSVFRLGFMAVLLLLLSTLAFKTVEVPARHRLRSMFARLEERRTIGRQPKIAA